MNGSGNSYPASELIVLHTHYPSFAGDLNGGGARELRRKRHSEFNLRILANLAIDVKKYATGAYVPSFCVDSCIGSRKPQPHWHFKRKSGEYALFVHGQGF